MTKVTQEMKDEIKEIVYDFFAEECEVELESLNDDTNVIEDLEGDSLMFLELIEIFKKKHSLEIGMESIGKYVLKHPAETVGKIVDLIAVIIEHGGEIANLD